MSSTATEPNAPASGGGAFPTLPQQQEMPLALVRGQALLQMPQDLYIPPDALEVILDAFEGPLDLLLYLIRRQNLDILDIPIAEITRQYMAYIEMMRTAMRLELAAEYLLMAAILAEIKSRLLLPRPVTEGETEEDPRAELVRRLREYECFRKAGEDLDALPRNERDFTVAKAPMDEHAAPRPLPEVDIREMLLALKDVMLHAELFSHHAITAEPLSVRQRMSEVLTRLADGQFHRFESLFTASEGRRGIVVSFLAMLELARQALIQIVQERPLAPIYIQTADSVASEA